MKAKLVWSVLRFGNFMLKRLRRRKRRLNLEDICETGCFLLVAEVFHGSLNYYEGHAVNSMDYCLNCSEISLILPLKTVDSNDMLSLKKFG